ncbi:hypothetical protein QTP70_033750 [Hemibagrus guttatus]|uniref:Uncharacterized protein n=1 Tax=Hemibagrus guttatus TaxID=175788 RepID=A0AAE0QPF7_9TELE|nr:hypothetical protein QTP70_033750 [Hemibagrus guttatus]
MHSSNHIRKFTDDTSPVGLIRKNNGSAYREEVHQLHCIDIDKTKQMVVDFRRAQSGHSLLNIDSSSVEIINSTKFLDVHLAKNFICSFNTSSIKPSRPASPSVVNKRTSVESSVGVNAPDLPLPFLLVMLLYLF